MPCYYLIAPAEASSNLARYDGVRYGPRVEAPSFHEMVERTRDEGFGDEPKRRIMLGTYALSAGYYDAYYGQAQRVRTLIVQEHRAAFERFDLLVSPTSPTVAFPIGERAADPLAMYAADLPRSRLFAAGSQRSLRAVRGLPVGLQLIGPQFGENTLFRAGHALERELGFDRGAGTASRGGDVSAVATAWEPVIGLEIHVQLKTRTKMFCRCSNGSGGPEREHVPRLPRLSGALPVPTGVRSSGRSSWGSRWAARSRRRPSSRGRTTPIPIPEGLSDLPVRSTFLHWRYDRTNERR